MALPKSLRRAPGHTWVQFYKEPVYSASHNVTVFVVVATLIVAVLSRCTLAWLSKVDEENNINNNDALPRSLRRAAGHTWAQLYRRPVHSASHNVNVFVVVTTLTLAILSRRTHSVK